MRYEVHSIDTQIPHFLLDKLRWKSGGAVCFMVKKNLQTMVKSLTHPQYLQEIQKSRRCLAAFGSAGDLCRRSPSGLFARCAFKHGPSVRGNSGGSGFFLFKHGFFDIPLWFWRFHGYFLFSSLRSIVFKRLRATAGQGPMLRWYG